MVSPAQRRFHAFTLIELLVVVAIIALLISILLPSLKSAKSQAKAVQCGANLHHVGQAFGIYLTENNSTYPSSYIYANNSHGGYDIRNQPLDKEFGYLHWSWFLYGRGEVDEAAFQCPEFETGGAPRTNPGPDSGFWISDEQRDEEGNQRGSGGAVEDKQAPWMAYTANAAIVPRNKFTTDLADGGPRINKFVREGEISSNRRVILATEFHKNWIASAEVQSDGQYKSKSHRPISAFYHVGYGAGNNIYKAPLGTPGFLYGDPASPDDDTFGLRPSGQLENAAGLITGSLGPEVQAVGRHHPNGDNFGGTTNFLYTDGSVARTTILKTMRNFEWGDRFYSLTGQNEVRSNY